MVKSQGDPLNLREQPGHLIRRLHQAHKTLWAECTGGDLTSPQFAVLNIVQENRGIDQRGLGDLLGMDRTTTGQIADRLVSRGLLVKVKDEADGRRNLLRLSAEGIDVLRQVLPAASQVSEQLINGLSERDRRDFLRILNVLVDAHVVEGHIGAVAGSNA
jgi:DNA-binding MarR family transcriptional regulator